MSLVELVQTAINRQLDEMADEICQEYRDMVTKNIKHKQLSSGRAAGSIHVEAPNATTRRIGSDDLHLFWFEMGNGTGGIPKNPPPKAPMPLTFGSLGKLGKPKGYAMRVKNYEGKHCNEKVADRHR